MADQGASQARTNEIPFDRSSSFSEVGRGRTVSSSSSSSPANYTGNDGGSRSTQETMAGVVFSAGNRACVARSNAGVPRSKRDGLVRTYVLRRFLGWDGGTPVRWTSATNSPPQPGLTNITIEDEFLIRVSVGSSSHIQARKLLR